MRILPGMLLLAAMTNAFGQAMPRTAASPADFVPAGYRVFTEIEGDLNKDGQADRVLIIKGTDREKFVNDEYRGLLDRNRRGILIAFMRQDRYELALENRECFSSENEDGGVYFAPELDVSIGKKGNLLVQYAHGRYGYWSYTFRHRNGDFELIGYDASSDRGPVVQQMVSINLLSKRKLSRVNLNSDVEGADERFKEVWSRFELEKPIRLREIEDFDRLYLQ